MLTERMTASRLLGGGPMLIFLTNDDGIHAVGLRAMYNALRNSGHDVAVFAPLTEQSAVGHAVTISTPLRVREICEPGFVGTAVMGTPTDCMKLGIHQLLGKTPDLVISGINQGANVGPDILYSGTVSAATEGAHMGFPSLAISHDSFNPGDMSGIAEHAMRLIGAIRWHELPRRCVLNLNYPNVPVNEFNGLALCPQTTAVWHDTYELRRDPRGAPYWWITGTIPEQEIEAGSDRDLLSRGYATLTPLRFDFTDRNTLAGLAYLND